jgi:hypothetical protein
VDALEGIGMGCTHNTLSRRRHQYVAPELTLGNVKHLARRKVKGTDGVKPITEFLTKASGGEFGDPSVLPCQLLMSVQRRGNLLNACMATDSTKKK